MIIFILQGWKSSWIKLYCLQRPICHCLVLVFGNLFIKSVLRRSVYWSTGRSLIYYRIGPSAIGLLINGAINFGLALFLVRVGLYIFIIHRRHNPLSEMKR